MDRWKALSNYHQMSDTPENLDYDTVAADIARRDYVDSTRTANPLTVADDPTWHQRVTDETNLPGYLVPGLRTLYG